MSLFFFGFVGDDAKVKDDILWSYDLVQDNNQLPINLASLFRCGIEYIPGPRSLAVLHDVLMAQVQVTGEVGLHSVLLILFHHLSRRLRRLSRVSTWIGGLGAGASSMRRNSLRRSLMGGSVSSRGT